MRVTFRAFRGHFEVTLSISTSNFMCDACVMHTCTGLVGPKSGKVQRCVVHTCTGLVGPRRGKVKKLLVFKAFLKGSRGACGRHPGEERSEPDR